MNRQYSSISQMILLFSDDVLSSRWQTIAGNGSSEKLAAALWTDFTRESLRRKALPDDGRNLQLCHRTVSNDEQKCCHWRPVRWSASDYLTTLVLCVRFFWLCFFHSGLGRCACCHFYHWFSENLIRSHLPKRAMKTTHKIGFTFVFRCSFGVCYFFLAGSYTDCSEEAKNNGQQHHCHGVTKPLNETKPTFAPFSFYPNFYINIVRASVSISEC